MATPRKTRTGSPATSSSSPRTRRRVTSPSPSLTVSDEALYERVALRAYQLFQERGEEHGHDLADWFAAERLVKAELLYGPIPEEPLEVERE